MSTLLEVSVGKLGAWATVSRLQAEIVSATATKPKRDRLVFLLFKYFIDYNMIFIQLRLQGYAKGL